MRSNWKSEILRDILSLGSIVFYLLVVARALVGPFWIFFSFLLISASVLLIIFFLHKNFESYIARGIILAAGTSFFYNDLIFSIFAGMIYIAMIVSSSFLGNSFPKILKGLLFGILSTGCGYFAVSLIFEKPWY
jgi:hypothetical protein